MVKRGRSLSSDGEPVRQVTPGLVGSTRYVSAADMAGSTSERASSKRKSAGKTPTPTIEPMEEPVMTRLFSERVVTIFVGPARTKWSLHENLLSATSDFFRTAFNGGFKESADDTLALPEDDPHAFELFVRWLYGKALSPAAGGLNNSIGPAVGSGSVNAAASTTSATASASLTILLPPDRCRTTIQDYMRLYVLASKLLVEELENTVVDIAQGYYKVGTRRPDIRDVQYVYENTPPAAGMRRLLKERLTLGLFRGKHNNPLTPEWRDVMNETPDLGFDIISEISSWNWISGGNCPLRSVTGVCSFHRHNSTDICKA